jgi:hypothetical protein
LVVKAAQWAVIGDAGERVTGRSSTVEDAVRQEEHPR